MEGRWSFPESVEKNWGSPRSPSWNCSSGFHSVSTFTKKYEAAPKDKSKYFLGRDSNSQLQSASSVRIFTWMHFLGTYIAFLSWFVEMNITCLTKPQTLILQSNTDLRWRREGNSSSSVVTAVNSTLVQRRAVSLCNLEWSQSRDMTWCDSARKFRWLVEHRLSEGNFTLRIIVLLGFVPKKHIPTEQKFILAQSFTATVFILLSLIH